ELTIGLTARAEADGASIVGGDLGCAERLTVTVTAMGSLPLDQEPVRRSGARPGDVLAIGAHRLGRSAAGLALVLGERALVTPGGGARPTVVRARVRDPSAAGMVRCHDAPDPELSLGGTVGRPASATIDLSDGLIRDGRRLAAASHVTLDLDGAALPPDVEDLAPLARE